MSKMIFWKVNINSIKVNKFLIIEIVKNIYIYRVCVVVERE